MDFSEVMKDELLFISSTYRHYKTDVYGDADFIDFLSKKPLDLEHDKVAVVLEQLPDKEITMDITLKCWLLDLTTKHPDIVDYLETPTAIKLCMGFLNNPDAIKKAELKLWKLST